MDISKRKVVLNNNIFEGIKRIAFHEQDYEKQIELLKLSITWACTNSVGKFSDKQIEKHLSDIAKKYSVPNKIINSKSVLHVATKVYEVGGHARLIEKWIKFSSEDETHSLYLTNQNAQQVPEWLNSVVAEKNGEIYASNNHEDEINESLLLRETASEYEYIVLHSHMDDVVPLIAFGTEEFTRPIFLYNHADHMFWVGLSIADVLLDLSLDGKNLTQKKRGKPFVNSVLPIPIERQDSGRELRKNKINLKQHNKKIIVSMASEYKYRSIDAYDFIGAALDIVGRVDDVEFIVIGPDKKSEKLWDEAYRKSCGHVNAIGYKLKNEVEYYKDIVDIYIDSFPFNSYTSMLEFAITGKPVLSLDTPFSKLDVLQNKSALCVGVRNLVESAVGVLLGKHKISEYIIKDEVESVHGISAWVSKKNMIINSAPKIHRLNWEFAVNDGVDEYDIFLDKMFSQRHAYLPLSSKIGLLNNLNVFIILVKNGVISLSVLAELSVKLLSYILKRIRQFADPLF